ncbi:hypothetical protein K1719_037821 [Acacia pycnantha]|nr:hypothetical protein K1719_037821 [Acacia pycnantha]
MVFMDSIFYWNVRGGCGKGLLRNLKTLWAVSKPKVVILAETRMEDGARLKVLNQLGYDSIHIVPSSGRSGGLGIAWNSHLISLKLIESNRQFFHFECSGSSSFPFFITAIYAIPHSNFRERLWEELLRLSRGIQRPWAVLGDFNDIASVNERIGGKNGKFSRMQWFGDRLAQCGLSDVGHLEAEEWAVLKALEYAHQMNFRSMIVESDSRSWSKPYVI